MPPAHHVGQRIRALRIQRRLSQEQLAGPGVSASYVSLIESGRRRPSGAALETLAAALGTTPDYLIHGESAAQRRQAELDLRLAQLALRSGDAAEAERRFRLLQTVEGDVSTRQAVDQGLAEALERQGHLEQAIAAYEAIRTRAAEVGDVSWLTATIALVRCYREVGDMGRSADLGERALEQLGGLGLPTTDLHAQLGASVAFTAYERGDLARAQQLIERVMSDAVTSGSARAQGAACWNAAVIAADRGEIGTALDLSERALLHFHADGATRNAARLRNSYAALLLRADPPRAEQALDLLVSARDSLTELGSLTDVAYCETEIARAHLLLGDPAAAVEAARASLHHLPAAEDRLERSRALAVLADAWLASGDAEAARAAYREAAQTLSDAGAGRQAARVWRQLADHLERSGDLSGALAAMKAASAAVGVQPEAQPEPDVRPQPSWG
jgi:transcriptional regulator with XRE-family HTH domain